MNFLTGLLAFYHISFLLFCISISVPRNIVRSITVRAMVTTNVVHIHINNVSSWILSVAQLECSFCSLLCSTGGCCMHQQNTKVLSHHSDDLYWKCSERNPETTWTRTRSCRFHHQSTPNCGCVLPSCEDQCRKQCWNVCTQWSNWSWWVVI